MTSAVRLRAWAGLLALTLCTAPLVPAGPVRADSNTRLEDKAKVIELQAPGRWRTERSDHTLAASGFLGVIRAEVFVQVYANDADADAAADKWKDWRRGQGGSPARTR